jgi:hypothetical protein
MWEEGRGERGYSGGKMEGGRRRISGSSQRLERWEKRERGGRRSDEREGKERKGRGRREREAKAGGTVPDLKSIGSAERKSGSSETGTPQISKNVNHISSLRHFLLLSFILSPSSSSPLSSPFLPPPPSWSPLQGLEE